MLMNDKTLTLIQAARYLKMSTTSLRLKAKNGKAPGGKVGKHWVFLISDLDDYIRSHYTYGANMAQGAKQEKKEWHFASEELYGGLTSITMEKEYDALVKQVRSQKRSNSMTS
jgi:hypothetical protein